MTTSNPIDPSQLLGVFAASDCTQPPCWRTDVLLGALEKLQVHTDGTPREFATTCQNALSMISDPSTHALLKLGVINGLRRPNDADINLVQNLFAEVRAEIDVLPDGPRKDRCRNFWRYQARVFLARNGFYVEAAKAEAEEASEATSPEGRAVSHYLSLVYLTWAALVGGHEAGIRLQLDRLYPALLQLQQDVAGTSLEVQWGQGNGPVHVLQAYFLNEFDSSEWNTLLEELLNKREQLGPAFAPWIKVLEAENKMRCNGEAAAIELASCVVWENASEDTTAAARLIMARAYARQRYNRLMWASIYQLVQPTPNAHMIAAVAKRELTALNG